MRLGARWLLPLLPVLCACAGPRGGASDPADLIRQWNTAVVTDKPQVAYALLDGKTRSTLSYPSFLASWRAEALERQAQARALVEGLVEPNRLQRSALVTLPGERRAQLTWEPDLGWLLRTPLISTLTALTPQQVLRHLQRAAENLSVDQMLRILTQRSRERFQALLEDFRRGLAENDGGEVQVSGDRAVIEWRDEKGLWRVKLLLEDGQWRIDDIVPPVR